MNTVGESDSSEESSSENNEQTRGRSEIQRRWADERTIWKYNMKESWEDESLVKGDGGAVEEGEDDGGEDQSLSTKDSRESGDTLLIKDITDISDKAYVPTSSDSEESVKSEPTKHKKRKSKQKS